MKFVQPFTYEATFTPEISAYYSVCVTGKEEPLRIEFTNESVEEEMLGFESYECWDEEETKYTYYCNEFGYHVMKTTDTDGDITELFVEKITKIEKEEQDQGEEEQEAEEQEAEDEEEQGK